MLDISFKNRTGLKPEILSAIIGADSFFYGLFSSDNKLLECQYYDNISISDPETISRIKIDIFSSKGLDVKVAYTGKPYLHVDKDNGGTLNQYFPAFQNKHIDDDVFTDQDIIVDYGFTKNHLYFLDRVFEDGYKKFHISTVLANYYYPYTSGKVVALIDINVIHIIHAKDQNFVYYNQFICEDEKDFLYFVLMVYKELNLDTEVTPLELAGKLDEKFPVYKLLHGYVKNIEMMRSSILDVKDLRYKACQHFYLDLFATSLCV